VDEAGLKLTRLCTRSGSRYRRHQATAGQVTESATFKAKKTQDGVDGLVWLKDLKTSVATTESSQVKAMVCIICE